MCDLDEYRKCLNRDFQRVLGIEFELSNRTERNKQTKEHLH